MRKYINLFFLLTGILSLESVRAQPYYPLKVGNRWDYKGSSWDISTGQTEKFFISNEIIAETLLVNGKKYFEMKKTDLTGGKFVRIDSNYVYYYNEYTSEEAPLYKLNSYKGERREVRFHLTGRVELEDSFETDILGYNDILLRFRLDGLILFYITLSKKFGPVYYQYPGEPPGYSSTGAGIIGAVLSDSLYGTLISVEREEGAKLSFQLSQNYPNPFNSQTKIKYQITSAGHVYLKVFNILGQDVATLVDGYQQPGQFTLTFNGDYLSSGIYFYQLKSGNFSETKKFILLK